LRSSTTKTMRLRKTSLFCICLSIHTSEITRFFTTSSPTWCSRLSRTPQTTRLNNSQSNCLTSSSCAFPKTSSANFAISSLKQLRTSNEGHWRDGTGSCCRRTPIPIQSSKKSSCCRPRRRKATTPTAVARASAETTPRT